MPVSTYGFGAALFRNTSFEKSIQIEFLGKSFSNFLNLANLAVLNTPESQTGLENKIALDPGQDNSCVWKITEGGLSQPPQFKITITTNHL